MYLGFGVRFVVIMFSENEKKSTGFNYLMIEKILVGIFSASIFVSKPAITISMALLVGFSLFRYIKDGEYRSALRGDAIVVSSIVVFIVGLFSRLLSPGDIRDVGYFLYKGLFLVVFPILLLAFRDKENRQLAFVLSMAGFSISVFMSFIQAFILPDAGWNGERVSGLWDILRWAEITTFVFVFLLAKLFDENARHKKYVIFLCMCFVAVSLILSGGRAGWVAVIVTSTLYMLFLNKKYLIVSALLLGAGAFIIGKWEPEKIEFVMGRALSVTETKEDYSNYSRLLMWGNGLKWIEVNMVDNPKQFLFGIGFKRFEKEYTEYLDSISDSRELINITHGNYSMRDLHNAYIDSSNKMGVLYTVLFYAFLVFVAYSFIRNGIAHQGVGLILSFMILGVFYANYLEFQTSVFFFLIALSYSSVAMSRRD